MKTLTLCRFDDNLLLLFKTMKVPFRDTGGVVTTAVCPASVLDDEEEEDDDVPSVTFDKVRSYLPSAPIRYEFGRPLSQVTSTQPVKANVSSQGCQID